MANITVRRTATNWLERCLCCS